MARIVPGCEKLDKVGENSFTGVVMLGAGPVKGRFDARIDLTDLDKPHRASLVGAADGPLGSSRGTGHFELQATDGGTLVRYSYSVELSGKVAAVGGRMLRGAARMLIDRFMRNLVRQAGGEAPASPGSAGIWSKVKGMVGGKK